MTYHMMKRLDHSCGICVAYRLANGLLSGHSLSVELLIETESLNEKGLIISEEFIEGFCDFVKQIIGGKLLVSEIDPELDTISALAGLGIADVIVLPTVGLEAFAFYIFQEAEHWLFEAEQNGRVKIGHVTVSDHSNRFARFVRSK